MWAVAGLSTIATLPWTGVVMMTTNKELMRIDGLSGAEQEKYEEGREGREEVVRLLKAWKWMNMVRAGLTGAGGLMAGWALLFG